MTTRRESSIFATESSPGSVSFATNFFLFLQEFFSWVENFYINLNWTVLRSTSADTKYMTSLSGNISPFESYK